jgi:hypothetical protein
MTREMNIILNTKEDRQMVETSMLLVIKTELNHLVQVDTGTEMNGIGNIAPGMNETEMIPQVVVATEMTDIMITGKNTEVMMIVEGRGTKESTKVPFLFIVFLNSFFLLPIFTFWLKKLLVYYRTKNPHMHYDSYSYTWIFHDLMLHFPSVYTFLLALSL